MMLCSNSNCQHSLPVHWGLCSVVNNIVCCAVSGCWPPGSFYCLATKHIQTRPQAKLSFPIHCPQRSVQGHLVPLAAQLVGTYTVAIVAVLPNMHT